MNKIIKTLLLGFFFLMLIFRFCYNFERICIHGQNFFIGQLLFELLPQKKKLFNITF